MIEIQYIRGKMVQLYLKPEDIKFIPRIGESVCIKNGSGYCKVVDVVHNHSTGIIKIYLA